MAIKCLYACNAYAIDHYGSVKTPETCDVQYKQTYKSENLKKSNMLHFICYFWNILIALAHTRKCREHLNELLKLFFQ